MVSYIKKQKRTSFEPSCVKIRQRVRHVGEFLKKGIDKNNFDYIFTHVPKSPPWTDTHLIWHSRMGRRRNHL